MASSEQDAAKLERAFNDAQRQVDAFSRAARDVTSDVGKLADKIGLLSDKLVAVLERLNLVAQWSLPAKKLPSNVAPLMPATVSALTGKTAEAKKERKLESPATKEFMDDFSAAIKASSTVTTFSKDFTKQLKEANTSLTQGKTAGDALKGVFFNSQKGEKDKDGKPKGAWDFSAFNLKDSFKSKEAFGKNFGKTAGAYAAAGAAGIAAVGTIMDATNVKGKGQRALSGAAAGASIGTQIMPGWGTAIGAGVGAIVGLARKPAFDDVYNKVKDRYAGIEISDDTAKAIAKQAKDKFKGDRRASETYSMDQIIKEGGGVKDSNAKELTARLRDAFVAKETGKFTDLQLTETLDKNFGAFAEHVVKSKELASKEFTELIQLNKRFGSESQAIQAFLTAQTGKVGAALAGMAAPLLNEFAPLDKKIAETKESIKRLEDTGRLGSEAHGQAVAKLAGLQAEAKQKAIEHTAEFERLGVIALGAFNAAVQGGTDYVTAMQQMGPALDQLIKLQTDHGITTENAALKELIAFREKVEANKALVLSADALGDAMLALSSIGALNVDTFKAMEEQGSLTFERLMTAGFTENEALMQMREFLDSARDAHEQLGFPIDENTARLIDQAEKAGILKATQEDMNKKMTEGLTKCTDALILVAKGLGVDIPAAAGDTAAALGRLPNNIDINVNYHTNGELPDLGNSGSADGGAIPGWANGTGGFRNFGSGTLSMLHGWEAVIPMNRLRGAGGGQGVEVNVWLNDDIIGRAAARGLPAMLDVYGATR
jgi:hypothetical protein